MARRPIPKHTETEVLTRSRRRCCICFGLDRDTAIKNGQIAHLDKNRDNSSKSNLAYLCFHHHDEYDSTTSQRKNLTTAEVKKYRDELESALSDAFSQKVHFGYLTTPPSDPYAGNYTRIGGSSNGAEIVLTPLPDSPEGNALYYVSGEALWGADREYGPNMGFLGTVAELESDCIRIHHPPLTETDSSGVTEIVCHRNEGILIVTEHAVRGQYGMNVTFEGTYTKSE